LFDDDGNGSISVEELMILLSASMGIDKGSSPQYMEGIMRKIDKDDSGMASICTICMKNSDSMCSCVHCDKMHFTIIIVPL